MGDDGDWILEVVIYDVYVTCGSVKNKVCGVKMRN